MRILLLVLVHGGLFAGDVPTIDNEMEPEGTAKRLVFEEDLRLGGVNEEADYFLWSGVNLSVAAAPNGHVFVGDMGGNRIIEFDAGGAFVRQIGGPGEGPSEYGELNAFHVFEDGTAVGVDIRARRARLLHYNKQGQFVRDSQLFGNETRRIVFSSRGDHAMVELMRTKDQKWHILRGWTHVKKQEFQQVNSVALPRIDTTRIQDTQYLAETMGNFMVLERTERGLVGLGGNGSIYTAVSNKYRISRWKEGVNQAKYHINKKYKPKLRDATEVEALVNDFHARFQAIYRPVAHMVTHELVAKAYEKSALPKAKDPLLGLLVLPNDHLLAVHQPDAVGTQNADLFDPSGKLIGSSSAVGNGFVDTEWKVRMIFRGEFAYTIETVDEEDTVVRYRYTIK